MTLFALYLPIITENSVSNPLAIWIPAVVIFAVMPLVYGALFGFIAAELSKGRS